MITDTLQKLGLNKKEIEVFLTVQKFGKITPAEVAKITRINRATIYSTAKSLIKKQLLQEDLAGSSLHLTAIPPKELENLLLEDRKNIVEKEQLIQKGIEELVNIGKNTTYYIPKIRFVDEANLKDFLYKEQGVWSESIKKHDNTWWGFQDHTFVEHYEEWIDGYWHEYPNAYLKLFSNDSTIEERMKGRHAHRDIRFYRKSLTFTATTWICGDYVIIISTKDRPHYLVEIHDATLAYNLRELFKSMWE